MTLDELDAQIGRSQSAQHIIEAKLAECEALRDQLNRRIEDLSQDRHNLQRHIDECQTEIYRLEDEDIEY